MITGHVFIAASLDGFIARENGELDWLFHSDQAGEDHGYADFIKDIDVIVMGRGTFEAVRAMGNWLYNRAVLVLSSQLSQQEVPADLTGKVRFSGKSAQEAMAMLEAEGYRRAYIDGGRVIQSFLELNMIRDIVITRVPVLLGAGRPLFGSLGHDVSLAHTSTKSFPSGLVQSSYTVKQ
ncbi:dihydrofolate reductase family protein [Brucella sp. TWI432]